MAATGCSGSSDSSASAQASSASTSVSTDAPSEIRLGYQAYANSDLIVKNSGWLEKAFPDTKFKWSKFDSGADVNTAFLAGALDIGLLGSAPASAGLSQPQNIPYQVSWIFDVTAENEALVATKDSGVETVKGLVGKKVATPFGSTAHYALLAALKEGGVDAGKVNIIDLQPPDILAAWQRGDIDATYVWDPTLATLKKSGTTLITSKEVADLGYPTYTVGAITRAFSTAYPSVVQEWLRIQNRAIELIQNDPNAAAKAIGAELALKPAEVLLQLKSAGFLNAKQQEAPAYFGTPNAPGRFVDTLFNTSTFLKEQGKVEGVPTKETLQSDIDTQNFFDAFNK